jgi:hypothetical protein
MESSKRFCRRSKYSQETLIADLCEYRGVEARQRWVWFGFVLEVRAPRRSVPRLIAVIREWDRATDELMSY